MQLGSALKISLFLRYCVAAACREMRGVENVNLSRKLRFPEADAPCLEEKYFILAFLSINSGMEINRFSPYTSTKYTALSWAKTIVQSLDTGKR
jgi:hypothetical protein